MNRLAVAVALISTVLSVGHRSANCEATKPSEFKLKPCPDGSMPHEPVPIRQTPSEYSAQARRAGIHGTVWISGRVMKNGQVVDVKLQRGVHKLLDDAALKAVSDHKFEPARCGEEPVEVRFTVGITFSLKK